MSAMFVFESAEYGIELTLQEWDKQRPTIKLPDGRYVHSPKWFPTDPPRPMKIEEVIEFEEGNTIDCVLLKEAPPPLVIDHPLTRAEIRNLIRHQRLRFKFRMPFEEYLDFTIGGFTGWVQMQFIHEQVKGNFRDTHFRPIEIINNDLIIEVNTDPRDLH